MVKALWILCHQNVKSASRANESERSTGIFTFSIKLSCSYYKPEVGVLRLLGIEGLGRWHVRK